MQQTATGQITLRRLTNGDTIQSYLQSDKTLIQVVDEDGNSPTPNWTDGTKMPTITPRITSTMGRSIQVRTFDWYMDGTHIAGSGFATVSGYELMSDNGIKIKKNIIVPNQVFSHVLSFKAQILIDGKQQTEVNASTSIMAIQAGANAYTGLVEPKEFTLDDQTGSVTIKTSLLKGVSACDSEWRARWFRVRGGSGSLNDEEITTTTENTRYYKQGNSLVVKRDGVDGATTFIAKFEINDSGKWKEVDGESAIVHDMTDSYTIAFRGVTEVDPSSPVESERTADFYAFVINTKSGQKQQVEQGKWSLDAKSNYTLKDIPTTAYTFEVKNGEAHVTSDSAKWQETIDGKTVEIEPVMIFEAVL